MQAKGAEASCHYHSTQLIRSHPRILGASTKGIISSAMQRSHPGGAGHRPGGSTASRRGALVTGDEALAEPGDHAGVDAQALGDFAGLDSPSPRWAGVWVAHGQAVGIWCLRRTSRTRAGSRAGRYGWESFRQPEIGRSGRRGGIGPRCARAGQREVAGRGPWRGRGTSRVVVAPVCQRTRMRLKAGTREESRVTSADQAAQQAFAFGGSRLFARGPAGQQARRRMVWRSVSERGCICWDWKPG